MIILNLTLIKRGGDTSFVPERDQFDSKRIQRLEIKLKRILRRETVQDFLFMEIRFTYITRRRWLNEDTEKVVFKAVNLVAGGTLVTQELVSCLKRSINSKPNDCNAIISFNGVKSRNL